jgi:hypothetical protein
LYVFSFRFFIICKNFNLKQKIIKEENDVNEAKKVNKVIKVLNGDCEDKNNEEESNEDSEEDDEKEIDNNKCCKPCCKCEKKIFNKLCSFKFCSGCCKSKASKINYFSKIFIFF